ncbi:Rho GTPase-activating protein syde2 [Cichlidogyrus casuarinus]|uniref:Rho GTPase-activating protein syde2 n=1 Tax=Cichlidogyrus casuarinus TaxID=1844966 RepID=A0ABD2Q9U8_9PLAT
MLAGCHSNPMLQKLRLKELERSKFLTKFDIKEHRLVVSSLRTFISRPVQNPSSIPTGPGLSGVLCINLIGGMSLQSPQTLLRDLYCVFEVENTRRARSVIRTNTECFAWEEEFELEVNMVQSVTCLLYQWDRRARHKLCFYGNIDLPSLFLNLESPAPVTSQNKCSFNSGDDSGCFTGSSSATISQDLGSRGVEAACKREEATAISPKMDKIALQMEPNGLLYLELAWFPMRLAYSRTKASPSANHNIPLFGCPLRLVLNRERAKIPYIIEKCVSEVRFN